MICPKCKKPKLGELQSVCTYCGHCDGNDRWYSEDDELSPVKPIDT